MQLRQNGWNDAETASNGALLMGLFYAGFGIANIFMTPFGSRIGPRKSLVVIILLWSLLTYLAPLEGVRYGDLSFLAGVPYGAFLAGNVQIIWLMITLLSMSVFCVSARTASEFALVQSIVSRDQVTNGVGL